MTAAEIVEELKNLTARERLVVIETAARLIEEDLRPPVEDADKRLAEAAAALREDYESDPELTAFTSLDGEPFTEAG